MHSLLHKTEQAHDEGIWTCCWGHNIDTQQDFILTGSLDNHIKIWNWNESENLRQSHSIEAHQLGVISSDVNQEATRAVTSSTDSMIKMWELASGENVSNIDCRPMDSWTVKLSPDSQKIATGSIGGKINIYDINTGEKSSELETGGKFVLSVTYSPDGRILAAASQEGIIYLFDVETEKQLTHIECHALPIRTLCFTLDSQLLLTGSDDKYSKIHDIAGKGNIIATLPGHTSWVLGVDASPATPNQFVTCSADRTVKVWDIGERQAIHTFNEHLDQVWCVKYNNNGSRMVSVSEDKSVNVYAIPV